jgi:hypothetical protein
MDWSLGSFGDLRLDKGGGDPRTDGHAQDGAPEPILGPASRIGPKARPRAGSGPDPWAVLAATAVASYGLAGRFFASPKVTVAKLVDGWSDRTGAACAGRHVLAIQSLPRHSPGALAS